MITRTDYLLYLPEQYESQKNQKWPLILFLHGAGERGDDINRVKKHGPPKLIEEGRQFPFIVVSPQCLHGEWWSVDILNKLLDEVIHAYRVDVDRIYLTGLSMGGFGTWSLAAGRPDRFAAIAPVCGGGDTGTAKQISHIPAWVFHGAKDPVVPLKRSEEMVNALKNYSDRVKFTVYPEDLHDSWTETYEGTELYDWFLEQKRHQTHLPEQ